MGHKKAIVIRKDDYKILIQRHMKLAAVMTIEQCLKDAPGDPDVTELQGLMHKAYVLFCSSEGLRDGPGIFSPATWIEVNMQCGLDLDSIDWSNEINAVPAASEEERFQSVKECSGVLRAALVRSQQLKKKRTCRLPRQAKELLENTIGQIVHLFCEYTQESPSS